MEVEDLALELIFVLYEQLEQLPILRQMVGFLGLEMSENHAVGGVARVEGGDGAIVGLGSSVIG